MFIYNLDNFSEVLRLRVNHVIVKVVKGFQRLLLTGKNHIFDLFRCLKLS